MSFEINIDGGRNRRSKSFFFEDQVNTSKAPPDPTQTELVCMLIGVQPRYVAPDESFAIWHAEEEATGRGIVIVGPLAHATPGERLTCDGKYMKHPKFGWQFKVRDYHSTLPQTAEGVETWLQRRIKHVGPTLAKAIVEHFGADKIYQEVDADPTRLREVKTAAGRSISANQMEELIESWNENKAFRQVETFLTSADVKKAESAALYKRYGAEIADVLQENPYQITELKGIGFKTADRIGRAMGIGLEDPRRLEEGILFLLHEEKDRGGHVFVLLENLFKLIAEKLFAPDRDEYGEKSQPQPLDADQRAKVVAAASALVKRRKLIAEDDPDLGQRVYLWNMYVKEVRLAQRLRDLLAAPAQPLMGPADRPVSPEGATEQEILAMRLPTDDQWSVVEQVRHRRLSILMGGPGVGKTTSQIHLVEAVKRAGKTLKLAAPTGKAARRMSELTGETATTIHRLLEYSPEVGGFQRDETNPIEADLLIIDETSMLDLELADHLFRAIGPHTHVLLVGDPDQLPPVGAGRVFADLISLEGAVPRVHLVQIFRQAAKSMIIQNARRINSGKLPFLTHDEAAAGTGIPDMNKDFFWSSKSDSEDQLQQILAVVTEQIPRTFKMDPKRDVMVLAPMHKTRVGLDVLNRELEQRLNPRGIEIPQLKLHGIRVGSRVVQTKNDYQFEVMNGEIGIVADYRENSQEIKLSLDDGDREIWMPTASAQEFKLSWALSIHKSQGSEFKAVVMPITYSHYTMLSRALYYTAITRARELVVMVGEKKALHRAASHAEIVLRNSLLGPRILDPTLSGSLF